MKVTVLGKSPAWQDAGGACSGYLVEEGDLRVLIDCGNGVFGKLREHLDYLDVDAVVISHMHADHTLDLVPYAYALTYSPRQQPVPVGGYAGREVPVRPELQLPPGGATQLRSICTSWQAPELVDHAFRVGEYAPGTPLAIGELTFTFGLVPHYIPTYAIRVSAADGRNFTYGADCCPNDELVVFAADTDLLLIEATLPRPERSGLRGHLTGAEAGEHARRAGAKRVVLTHIPDEIDQAASLADAEEAFGRPAEIAREGLVIEL